MVAVILQWMLHDMPEHISWVCMFGDEGTPSLVWSRHCHFQMLSISVVLQIPLVMSDYSIMAWDAGMSCSSIIGHPFMWLVVAGKGGR